MSHPYRSSLVVAWAGPSNDSPTVWMTSHHTARIGFCTATIKPASSRTLPPYVTWMVTRDRHLTMTGTAEDLETAKGACERAARILNRDGWPSAFAAGGFLEG